MESRKSRIRNLLSAARAGGLEDLLAALKENPHILVEMIALQQERRKRRVIPDLRDLHEGQPHVASFLAEELLRAVREDRIPVRLLYGVLHDFGELELFEAEPDIVRFTTHERPSLRYIALSVLSFHWDKLNHRDLFERMLLDDPDETVRSMAAGGLGFLLRESTDARATALLLGKFRDNNEHSLVRESTYRAILEIWFGQDTALSISLRSSDAWDELRRQWDAAYKEGNREAIDRVTQDMDDLWRQFVDWEFFDLLARGDVPDETVRKRLMEDDRF